MKNPLQSSSIDFENLADYMANAMDDDESPVDAISGMEVGVDKAQAKKLIDAWYKVDPKKRLSITMNKKQFDTWLKNQLGDKAESLGRVASLRALTEDTVYTKKGLNGTLGIIRADSNDSDGQYHEVIIQRGDQEFDRKKIDGDLDKAKEYLMSQWDKYESRGKIASLKRLIEDKLPGGKGDKADPSQFDPKEIEMGLKVEMEHTTDKEIAMEIVLDHLSEDPTYYSKLATVHQEALNTSDLKDVETEVRASFEDSELKAFKNFEDFFAAVDVQNGYEDGWKPKKWKPYYKAVYDKIIKELA